MVSQVEANQKVHVEMTRFNDALPKLLADANLVGRWVVFLDGEVRHVDESDRNAYRWAVENLGQLAGFVLAQVVPKRVIKIGGAMRTRSV